MKNLTGQPDWGLRPGGPSYPPRFDDQDNEPDEDDEDDQDGDTAAEIKPTEYLIYATRAGASILALRTQDRKIADKLAAHLKEEGWAVKQSGGDL